jgi:glycosyltransferase involved in cell wall biosynthesis
MVRTPYVLWALGSDINKYRQSFLVKQLLKRIIRNASGVFADGFDLCSTIYEISGITSEFLPTFRKIDLPVERHESNNGRIYFLFVGRHAKVKGIDVLINAIIRLGEKEPMMNYHVTIAGDGELTSEMIALIDANNLNQKVTFVGKVTDSELFALYARTDCVIIPSRSESIPVVFSEALQCNTPMIVTDVGDMGILGEKYGVAQVVARENAGGIANAMRDFVENPFRVDPDKRNELLSLLMLENYSHKIDAMICSMEVQ